MNFMWVVWDHVGFPTGIKGNELFSCNFWAPQIVSATAQALCLVFLGLVNLSVSYIFWALQLEYYCSTTVSVAVAATVAVADAVADATANELQLLLQSLCFFVAFSRAAIERLIF